MTATAPKRRRSWSTEEKLILVMHWMTGESIRSWAHELPERSVSQINATGQSMGLPALSSIRPPGYVRRHVFMSGNKPGPDPKPAKPSRRVYRLGVQVKRPAPPAPLVLASEWRHDL